MISREEKNKEIVNELKKEQARKISKKIFLIIFWIFVLSILLFSYVYFIGVKGLITKEYVISDTIPDSFNGTKFYI